MTSVYFYWMWCLVISICSSLVCVFLFFFFKQNTAYEMRISDWSSDVCSSDLGGRPQGAGQPARDRHRLQGTAWRQAGLQQLRGEESARHDGPLHLRTPTAEGRGAEGLRHRRPCLFG